MIWVIYKYWDGEHYIRQDLDFSSEKEFDKWRKSVQDDVERLNIIDIEKL